ncbi:putative protein kinase RLK-Pelle-SD-2b family [Medicago truncatula]|uniref:non-specific serine/threonine protein kinase n=1 Tax=Medicago truncatula TaxID=3880 RepID=A0A396J0V6_MEDTR|nr:putative protein kinase RLK-Pelle-SD-2b family [Medicago truncatula]
MHLTLLSLLLFLKLSSYSAFDTMNQGSSLSVEEQKDIIVSQNGMFSAGFYAVGENAYSFAIWFSEPNHQTTNLTIVWIANRGQPVNGKGSKLFLLKHGNLVLRDADESHVWSTNTASLSSVDLQLLNTGNLVLHGDGFTLWQSFDFPTDTLLPNQVFNRHSKLVCSISETNKSSGFYTLYFDNDNILRLLYDGPEVSSIYWPDPWLTDWDAKRAGYNNSKVAVLNTIDLILMETFALIVENMEDKNGYKMKNHQSWAYGCEPEFSLSCNRTETRFLVVSNVELFGYDYSIVINYTLEQCKELCLQLCNCKGIQYTYVKAGSGIPGTYTCYPKMQLRNAYRIPYFNADLHIKLPANSSYTYRESMDDKYKLACLANPKTTTLETSYNKVHEGRKFSYSELKKATKSFSQEIGKGAGGIVYKGVLLDQRVVAVKRLKEANQGEEEFLAEVSSIGKLNHMNLIEMWGYCAEGKHRMLVYEFMDNGSLAEHIKSNKLDWGKRFDIALGTAKGLAYIHEECLEWILHCDVKPQNILLDSNYQPKISDFGLSKLRNRKDSKFSSFSKIRGTRGYMAPEWILNHSITSKVDVYSYGMVVLEMITGRSATKDVDMGNDKLGLVIWLREKRYKRISWINEIMDPTLDGGCDESEVEALAEVAMQCVEEEKDKRPTMSHVVEVLQKICRENDDQESARS